MLMMGGNKLASESPRGFGISVSQSLGIDKSVDSLALDEYDHIEIIDWSFIILL